MKARGFTLIEMMVALAIIAVMAAAAMPTYTEYMRRGARADAQLALQEAAQYLERIYTECNDYTLRDASTTPPCTTKATALPLDLQTSPRGGKVKYNISTTARESQSYTLRAVPVDTADRCGSFVYASTGARTLESNTATVAECWRR